jgi:hypothetical protein
MGLDAVHPGLLVNYNTDGMAITMRNAPCDEPLARPLHVISLELLDKLARDRGTATPSYCGSGIIYL